MVSLTQSINYFDRFSITLLEKVIRAKKQPKKNTFKKCLSVRTVYFGNVKASQLDKRDND